MKKLSLLLALLMVVSCFVLASCGDEETTSEPATSTATSSAAADESTPADESSSATEESTPATEESTPADESSEESVEEPTIEKNPEAKPTDGQNVAAGKTYEISEQYRMGGADAGWGYDPNANPSYPDNNYELTDGYIPTNDDAYSADCWMAFNQSTPEQTARGYGFVKMDLGESYVLSELTITSLKDSATGITCPYIIEVLVSEDGETYTSAGMLELASQLEGLADKSAHALTMELDCTGRYVEIHVISYGWAFMGEIVIK